MLVILTCHSVVAGSSERVESQWNAVNAAEKILVPKRSYSEKSVAYILADLNQIAVSQNVENPVGITLDRRIFYLFNESYDKALRDALSIRVSEEYRAKRLNEYSFEALGFGHYYRDNTIFLYPEEYAGLNQLIETPYLHENHDRTIAVSAALKLIEIKVQALTRYGGGHYRWTTNIYDGRSESAEVIYLDRAICDVGNIMEALKVQAGFSISIEREGVLAICRSQEGCSEGKP